MTEPITYTTKDGEMITFISHDPSRRHEKPRDITNDLIKIILDRTSVVFLPHYEHSRFGFPSHRDHLVSPSDNCGLCSPTPSNRFRALPNVPMTPDQTTRKQLRLITEILNKVLTHAAMNDGVRAAIGMRMDVLLESLHIDEE